MGLMEQALEEVNREAADAEARVQERRQQEIQLTSELLSERFGGVTVKYRGKWGLRTAVLKGGAWIPTEEFAHVFAVDDFYVAVDPSKPVLLPHLVRECAQCARKYQGGFITKTEDRLLGLKIALKGEGRCQACRMAAETCPTCQQPLD